MTPAKVASTLLFCCNQLFKAAFASKFSPFNGLHFYLQSWLSFGSPLKVRRARQISELKAAQSGFQAGQMMLSFLPPFALDWWWWRRGKPTRGRWPCLDLSSVLLSPLSGWCGVLSQGLGAKFEGRKSSCCWCSTLSASFKDLVCYRGPTPLRGNPQARSKK